MPRNDLSPSPYSRASGGEWRREFHGRGAGGRPQVGRLKWPSWWAALTPWAWLPWPAGGPRAGRPTYSALQRERILAEARRAPVPAQDGTARWSLSTLQRALRQAPEGLPRVSTYTIWDVLRQAGYRFGRTRA